MLASELFALSQGGCCRGSFKCYWCAGPCEGQLTHQDHPRVFGEKRDFSAVKNRSSPYICNGCLLWQREKCTVNYLNGGYTDSQTAANHSWFITQQTAWALRPWDYPKLYDYLLNPPHTFCLTFKEGKQPNLIQLAVVNDNQQIRADDWLSFTIGGTVFRYSVYELNEALLTGPNGKESGVRLLLELLGPPPEELKMKRQRGRPTKEETRTPDKVITAKSGT